MRGKGGRISATERESAIVQGDFGPKRAEPPPELTKYEQDIWRATTAAEPAGFFTDGAVLDMLADYCAHRATIHHTNQMLNRFEDEWLKNREGLNRYHTLLKIRDQETRAAAHLATKLRLTNQSRFRSDVKTNKMPGQPGPMPWEE
jgi:hypothetical protein